MEKEGGGMQEAGEVTNGGRERERRRTGSCESCKNLGHQNSSTYSLSASSLGTLNGAMEGEGRVKISEGPYFRGLFLLLGHKCIFSWTIVYSMTHPGYLSSAKGFPRFSVRCAFNCDLEISDDDLILTPRQAHDANEK